MVIDWTPTREFTNMRYICILFIRPKEFSHLLFKRKNRYQMVSSSILLEKTVDSKTYKSSDMYLVREGFRESGTLWFVDRKK